MLLIECARGPRVDRRGAAMLCRMSCLALAMSDIVPQRLVDTHEDLRTDAQECLGLHMGQTVAECRHGVNVE